MTVRDYRVSGSGAVLPIVEKLAAAYAQQAPHVRIVVESGTNTGGAITGVLQGTLDLVAASRPLSEAEVARPLTYTPFVRDAMVLAARRPTTITNLSAAQVREIYGGAIKSWAKVGGTDSPIIVLDRDADEALRKLAFLPLMGGHPVQEGLITLTSTGDMLTALESTPGSIGYAPFGYVNLKGFEAVRVLNIDGVTPSVATIEDRSYPWQLVYGLITQRDAPEELRQFVDYAARSGPSILREFGYAAP